MKSRLLKGIATVVGAVILSTAGIYASDALQGGTLQFASLSNLQKDGICTEGSVPVKVGEALICVDIYEVSPSEACPHHDPLSLVQSEKNASTKDCYAMSVAGGTPWGFISLPQAQRMCAAAGKRLPTSREWYHIALGTPPEMCIIESDGAKVTGTEGCVSTAGAYDTVGNLWEWVNENVVGNQFGGRTLPTEGYVTSVDADGVAITSAQEADEVYGRDYFWSKEEGVFGMIRGGFYGSNQDAGLYTINASVPTSFAAKGVGFRCVRDVL